MGRRSFLTLALDAYTKGKSRTPIISLDAERVAKALYTLLIVGLSVRQPTTYGVSMKPFDQAGSSVVPLRPGLRLTRTGFPIVLEIMLF
jgi:hypothetical protein